MPATEPRPDFRHRFHLTSELSPETLFDLLAEPRGCLSWHVHPKGTEVLSVDAPPGAALAGTEFTTESAVRGHPIFTRTRVVEAVRPIVYATESETTIPKSAVRAMFNTERYVLEPSGRGTIVTYEATATRKIVGFPYVWPILKLNDRFFARAALERCTRDFIDAAQRHVTGAAV
jgi:hypothetical protein